MPPTIDYYFSFVFFIAVLGIVVSAILYFLNKNESFSARLLAGFLFCTSIISLFSAAYHTTFFLHYPHVARTMVFLSLSASPFSFLYIRSILKQQYRFQRTDLLFFIPAVLYTINMIPFYLLPTHEKLDFISRSLADRSLVAREPEGLLPEGWGIIFRMTYGLVLAGAQFILLIRWRKKIFEVHERVSQNVETFKWLFYFTVVVSCSFLLLFFEYIFQVSQFFELYRLITLTMTGTILFTTLYLLIRPNILYGLTGWLQEPVPEIKIDDTYQNESVGSSKPYTLSVEQEKVFKAALENHFDTQQPFLRPGYKMKDLSDDLDIPSYLLSAFINQEYGMNFNELVNKYRVDHLKTLLRNSPELYQYTLEALGKMAGFNSRSTFISAVKKVSGKTPLEYYNKQDQ